MEPRSALEPGGHADAHRRRLGPRRLKPGASVVARPLVSRAGEHPARLSAGIRRKSNTAGKREISVPGNVLERRTRSSFSGRVHPGLRLRERLSRSCQRRLAGVSVAVLRGGEEHHGGYLPLSEPARCPVRLLWDEGDGGGPSGGWASRGRGAVSPGGAPESGCERDAGASTRRPEFCGARGARPSPGSSPPPAWPLPGNRARFRVWLLAAGGGVVPAELEAGARSLPQIRPSRPASCRRTGAVLFW